MTNSSLVANARAPPLPAALVRRGTDACFVVIDSTGQKLAYTAKTLGLDVPMTIQMTADEVIE